MFRYLMLLLIFSPQIIFTQADEIILPELDFAIDDQSSLNTASSEIAILKERTPQFQEVYLDELKTGITDASLGLALSQKNQNKVSYIQFSYGSFCNTQINTLSQNLVKNLFYRVSYLGQFRQNIVFNNYEYANTALYNNAVNTSFIIDLTNTSVNIDFSYNQNKTHFVDNIENVQFSQYIPTTIQVKKWLNDSSYLDIRTHVGVSLIEFQNTQGLKTKNKTLIDSDIDLSYKANFTDWNYFEMQFIYYLNDYSQYQAHTGLLKIKSDFLLGKGFGINIGMVLVASSVDNFFGWPEIAMIYNYLDIVAIDLSVSGDFNLYNAEKSSKELQLYSFIPAPESRWIYELSFRITPSPYFWIGGDIQYSDYKNKRIYMYNTSDQIYSFMTTDKVTILSSGLTIGTELINIFDIALFYRYEGIQKDWLLYTPHKFDVLMNLGYRPVGFNLETRYTMYAPRNLTAFNKSAMIHLLNFRISQKIYQMTEVFIEVNNILNQNIQFISGTYYGGIQANGGVKLNF
mgnify:CR=1 FL=1